MLLTYFEGHGVAYLVEHSVCKFKDPGSNPEPAHPLQLPPVVGTTTELELEIKMNEKQKRKM